MKSFKEVLQFSKFMGYVSETEAKAVCGDSVRVDDSITLSGAKPKSDTHGRGMHHTFTVIVIDDAKFNAIKAKAL